MCYNLCDVLPKLILFTVVLCLTWFILPIIYRLPIFRISVDSSTGTICTMLAKNINGPNGKKPASVATNLIGMSISHRNGFSLFPNIAGGVAGMMEALVCHPLGIRSCILMCFRSTSCSSRYHQSSHATLASSPNTRSII